MNKPLIIPTENYNKVDKDSLRGQVINVWVNSQEEYEELAKAAELINNAWFKGLEKNNE
jgi:hypothetical protein